MRSLQEWSRTAVALAGEPTSQDVRTVKQAAQAAEEAGDELVILVCLLRYDQPGAGFVARTEKALHERLQLGSLTCLTTLKVVVAPRPIKGGSLSRIQASALLREAALLDCTGIIVTAKPKDSRLRRALIGESMGAKLAANSRLPVLYLPRAQLSLPEQACNVPATFDALQAQLLAQQSSAWQQPGASAA